MDLNDIDNTIKSGQVWHDNNGKVIQAHGGGMLYDNGTYYWFGENKGGIPTVRGRLDVIGVSCYSSIDLINWKDEGVVLPAVKDDSEHDLRPANVLERPKVVYNEKTGKYVMWMHIDTANYAYARAGVAVSDSPTGPYKYLGSIRPHEAMSRDMSLFKDDDGKAYLIYSSEHNSTMYVSLLTDDYLDVEGTHTKNFAGKYREAPAMFKRSGKYYLITSHCTGWAPNEAQYATAESPLGPWKVIGNPCVGEGASLTFYSQSTHVLPVEGKKDAYIFMADRWKPEDLGDSRYIWLPIKFVEDKVVIEWVDSWELSIFQ